MLTRQEKLSNLKCKVAKNSYIKLVESNYGIETCNDDYSEEMYLNDLLYIDLLSKDYDCDTRVARILAALPDHVNVGRGQTVPGGLRYNFLIPSTEWVISGLDIIGFTFNPNVTVLDMNEVVIDAEVSYPDYAKKIVIKFNTSTIGHVDLS